MSLLAAAAAAAAAVRLVQSSGSGRLVNIGRRPDMWEWLLCFI